MWDIALDLNTGDLIPSASGDFQGRDGSDLTHQRMIIRLRVPRGSWHLDPTGTLGSRLKDVMRLPDFRAVPEAQLVVEEALRPMDDIEVVNVTTGRDEGDHRVVGVQVDYQVRDFGIEEVNSPVETATFIFT